MLNHKKLLDNTRTLLKIPSDTPFGENKEDKFKACLEAINFCQAEIESLGAVSEVLVYEGGHHKWDYAVPNLYTEINIGNVSDDSDFIVYMGHIDVVPIGDEKQWKHKPFSAKEDEGFIYARGATDMKANITAFISAIAGQVQINKPSAIKVGMIITADEEWAAVNGSRKVLQWLKKQGKNPSKFIVGEPSSPDELASHIKVGRRGSLIGNIEISGVEGHRAYPSLYKNPNKLFQFVNMAVNSLKWNDGNNFIPDTDIEINAINSGNFVASAIVPNNLSAMYAIRYTDKQSKEQLFTAVRDIIANPPEYLKAHPDYKYYIDNLDYIKVIANLDTASIPYYSQPNKLAFNAVSAVEKILGRAPVLDSTGGTTDGRFVHEFFPDAEIIELGLPENGGIIDKIKRDDYGTYGGMHQINERASIKDIFNLANIYSEVINSLRIKNKNEQSDNRESNRARFRCNGASL